MRAIFPPDVENELKELAETQGLPPAKDKTLQHEEV